MSANPAAGTSRHLGDSASPGDGTHPRRFFFFHVPKTGGATIYSSFQRKFGGEVIRPKKIRNNPLVDVVYGRKFFMPPAAKECCGEPHIAGHFASMSVIAGREDEYQKICFWRHPADWFLSYYNWIHTRKAKELRRSFSFSDFTGSLLRNPMTQEFLLYCGDMPGWRYFFSSEREKFDAAVELAARFDLFADISKVDDYLRSAGLTDEGVVDYRHKIPDKEKKLRSLDDATRRRLERENAVDFHLSRLALGEDPAEVIADAHRLLSTRFDMGDVARQLVRPYFRLKVRFLPFFDWRPLGKHTGVLMLADQLLDALF